jgi:MFS transporter, LAT3 family, solute carrier family 43, member 3
VTGSIGYQLEQKGDDNGFYANLFSIVYAALAVVAPAGGFLSHRYGLGVTQGGSTILVAMSFFILGSHAIPLPGLK